jgi:hypothetical protein
MQDTTTDDAALAAEFDALARRAGLTIPEDRKAAMLQGYKDMKRMTALMRQHPRAAADEPAAAYSLQSITRSL